MLGVGLLISTVSATQQQAMVTAFFFIMPTITFSGFGFPISTMPHWMQDLQLSDSAALFFGGDSRHLSERRGNGHFVAADGGHGLFGSRAVDGGDSTLP
jgi:ABC-type multidrug transport system permease subunit